MQFLPGYLDHAEGSCLVTAGATRVLCAVSLEDRVPDFLVGKGRGWLTAEYAMLPRSTHTRSKRDPGGRGKEIQRLIGRALRAAVDLDKLGERTITVDCDVLCADGGTRVTSITGAWVAIAIAMRGLVAKGALPDLAALKPPVAAVSVGVVDGQLVLDLPYVEDSRAEVDMNVVATDTGTLVEVQGTGEGATFPRSTLDKLLDAALAACDTLFALQREALRTPYPGVLPDGPAPKKAFGS